MYSTQRPSGSAWQGIRMVYGTYGICLLGFAWITVMAYPATYIPYICSVAIFGLRSNRAVCPSCADKLLAEHPRTLLPLALLLKVLLGQAGLNTPYTGAAVASQPASQLCAQRILPCAIMIPSSVYRLSCIVALAASSAALQLSVTRALAAQVEWAPSSCTCCWISSCAVVSKRRAILDWACYSVRHRTAQPTASLHRAHCRTHAQIERCMGSASLVPAHTHLSIYCCGFALCAPAASSLIMYPYVVTIELHVAIHTLTARRSASYGVCGTVSSAGPLSDGMQAGCWSS
jgi:hypothetical protein